MDCATCMAFLREMTGTGVLILREWAGKTGGLATGWHSLHSLREHTGGGGGRMGTNEISGTLLHLKKEQQLQGLILIFLTGA